MSVVVTVDTTALPELVLPIGQTGGGSVGGVAGSLPDLLLGLLKPEITVAVDGAVVYQGAPYGVPAVNVWPVVLLGLIAGGFGLGYLIAFWVHRA